uniref:KaiC-like domain-containing protein n=1 Tax=Archaeoglobus fulgidus TaxID=2234 RepID=A0A7J2TIN7_ARCFL
MITNQSLVEKIKAAIDSGAEIILVKVDAKSYVKVSLEIVKFFSSFADGVYVTLNKPYFSLKRMFLKEGIDISKLYFIDSITMQVGGEIIDEDRCFYLNSPDPVQLQVAIERAMDLITSNNRFIYIDSLSTISLYKSFETLIKFLRHVTGKIRLRGFVGTIFTLEKEMDETYYSQISLMCDEVIEA